jgi:hypothetical protein
VAELSGDEHNIESLADQGGGEAVPHRVRGISRSAPWSSARVTASRKAVLM